MNRRITQSNYQKTLKECKVNSSFQGKIWGARLTDIQLISKYDKEIPFESYVFEIFSKY